MLLPERNKGLEGGRGWVVVVVGGGGGLEEVDFQTVDWSSAALGRQARMAFYDCL